MLKKKDTMILRKGKWVGYKHVCWVMRVDCILTALMHLPQYKIQIQIQIQYK